MTTYWAPLLHTYQPTFQDPKILRVINKECYKPLFSMLQEHENSAFSVNLNANLIDMLQEYNLSETLDIVNDLRSRGKIEIVGAAKYHPILPLISQKEAKRQFPRPAGGRRHVSLPSLDCSRRERTRETEATHARAGRSPASRVDYCSWVTHLIPWGTTFATSVSTGARPPS